MRAVVGSVVVIAVALSAAPTLAAPPALKAAPTLTPGPLTTRAGRDKLPEASEFLDIQFQGWASDGRDFGYCLIYNNGGDVSCDLMTPAGKEVPYFRAMAEQTGREFEQVRARHAKRKYRLFPKATWPYAVDVDVVWRVKHNKAEAIEILQLGARVRGKYPASYVLEQKTEPDEEGYAHIGVDYVSLSPDGAALGVMVRTSFWGIPAGAMHTHVVSSARLASAAYNTAGMVHHKRKEFARAVTYFRKATFADPSRRHPIYNLACALARLNDSETRTALSLAIRRHGPKVKAHARKDKDFDLVRGTKWFGTLTSGGDKR